MIHLTRQMGYPAINSFFCASSQVIQSVRITLFKRIKTKRRKNSNIRILTHSITF